MEVLKFLNSDQVEIMVNPLSVDSIEIDPGWVKTFPEASHKGFVHLHIGDLVIEVHGLVGEIAARISEARGFEVPILNDIPPVPPVENPGLEPSPTEEEEAARALADMPAPEFTPAEEMGAAEAPAEELPEETPPDSQGGAG